MGYQLSFPTQAHLAAADAAYTFFHARPEVDTVLVVNSCARGQATPESDLDMAVLVRPQLSVEDLAQLEGLWRVELASSPPLQRFQASGEHAHVHLDLFRGDYAPEVWDDGGGPDGFELGIGNQLAYGAPLHASGTFYRELQARWLPYYPEELRRQRLAMARAACLYDLGHVPFFVRRELYFQAFDRLYKAFQEFLQALFISRRVYPLAYNKWIKLQVAQWLRLPELYAQLPGIISVENIEGEEVVGKAQRLARLLDEYGIQN